MSRGPAPDRDAWITRLPDDEFADALGEPRRRPTPTLVLSPDTHREAQARETAAQVADAHERLDRPTDDELGLPWGEAVRLLGPILPDDVWTLMAASNMGKTTLLASAITRWLAARRRVWVIGLEEAGARLRLLLAAITLMLDAKRVVRNYLTDVERDLVRSHLRWQQTQRAYLHISSPDPCPIEALPGQWEGAAAFEADVIVLDHHGLVDLEAREGHGGEKRLCKTLKRCTNRYGIPLVQAVQTNRRANLGDPLAAFKVPLVDHLEGGKVIEQGSDLVVGAYRPLRRGLTKSDVMAWRAGGLKLRDLLEPNALWLAALKHRVDGAAKGELIPLRYDQGAIHDPLPVPMGLESVEDRYGV